jgi:hypothetical protein
MIYYLKKVYKSSLRILTNFIMEKLPKSFIRIYSLENLLEDNNLGRPLEITWKIFI